MKRLLAGVVALAAVVAAAGTVAGHASAAPPVAGAFTALAAPVRLMDTRPGAPHVGPNATLGPGQSATLQIEGQGGIPSSGVGAVALNVTAVSPTATGYLTVYPAGGAAPNASNLNFHPGDVVPNAVTVGLSSSGAIAVFNSAGNTDVIVDVAGWYEGGTATSAGAFTPISPTRFMDTRPGTHIGPNNTLGPGQTVSLTVAGASAVPAGAGAVVMNVTAVSPSAPGFVTAFPDGEARPTASNLNFTPGQVVPNQVTVKLGGGKVDFYNYVGSVDLIADVSGYYLSGSATAPGTFVPVVPTRVLDTRTTTPVVGGQSVTVDPTLNSSGVPVGGAAAVAANVTVTNPSSPGYVTAYPHGASVPTASNLNFVAGQTVPNAVAVGLDSTSRASLFLNAGTAHLIFDVAGYFVGAGPSPSPSPSPPPSLPAVQNLAATPSAHGVALSWTPPSGSPAAGYTVVRKRGSTPPANPGDGTVAGNVGPSATGLTDTGLISVTQYSYAVFPHDAASTPGYGTASTVTTTTTHPTAPDNPPTNVGTQPQQICTLPTSTSAFFMSANPGSLSCQQAVVAVLNSAREAMLLPDYAIPASFYSLPPATQLIDLVNQDRALYGLPLVSGINDQLNGLAQTGADNSADPAFGAFDGNTNFGGGSNWAGAGDVLLSYWLWVYDDGWDPGGHTSNLDCTSPSAPGCWGHRDNVVSPNYSGTIATGIGYSRTAQTYGSIGNLFEYVPQPSSPIYYLADIESASRAGTTATVLGDGFANVTEVLVNGVSASFTVTSVHRLTVTVPASGTAQIQVRTNSLDSSGHPQVDTSATFSLS